MADDVPVTDLPSRQFLLYDAATRWAAAPSRLGPDELIEAAASCLVDGIDSPTLRLLAGAAAQTPTTQVRELATAALHELGLPAPGALPPTQTIGADGRVAVRQPRDRVRFEVASTEPELAGHEVLVHVNDVEMTRIAAGMGMDPFDLLVPENLLVAATTPHQVGIARCDCGTYGCGATDVIIVRDGDVVHWDWVHEAPIRRGVTFPADAYDAEVARLGADHSWERPADTSARLVLTQVDHARLAAMRMRVSWVAEDFVDRSRLVVALALGGLDGSLDGGGTDEPAYQVFVRVSRAGRTPEDVAAEALRVLAEEPADWTATWHAVTSGAPPRPRIAGPAWRHEGIDRR